jgi:hypothetical protein
VNAYFHTELARARIQDAHHAAARHRLARSARRSAAATPPAENRLIGRSARDRIPAPVAGRPAWAPLASWSAFDSAASN